MTGKLGPKGQVVIPKAIRDRLGLRPGDRVVVEQDGEAARVSKAVTVDDLVGSLPESELDPLEVLLAERERDRRREARRQPA
jgi:AbrB family looped-hinge helix DNA binding protein